MNWAKLADEALAGFEMSSLPPTVELPALPHAVTLFVRRSRDESVPLQELAQILETDSTLTIELLKYVNSSSTGLRNKAKTVLQAITLLGCARCRLFVIATGMGAAVRSQCSKLIDQTAFWSDTLQKAIFAREIALLLRTDPDVAFVGALLQDFLLPFLTNSLTDDYREFLAVAPDASRPAQQIRRGPFRLGPCLSGRLPGTRLGAAGRARVLHSVPPWWFADLDRPQAGPLARRCVRAVGSPSRSVQPGRSRLRAARKIGAEMAGFSSRTVSRVG